MDKKIAVVGYGSWGKNLVRNFDKLDSLYAVCDVDESLLKTFGQKYPQAKTFSSVEELLTDPEIDAVVIATPPASHYSTAKKALQAGKDVFVEKPIALNYKDGEDLVATAQKKNKILMVGHILEYHPAIVKLKNLVDKGELGKINYIYSNRLNLGKFRTEENILWSFAPHDISVILSLLGEMPEGVLAYGGNYLNPHISDVTVTVMDFPSGVKAHIFVSWLHPYKEQKLVVVGDQKMVVFDDVSNSSKLSSYSHKIDWVERVPVPKPEKAQPIETGTEEPLKLECQHFLECLSSRSKPRTDGANGLRVLEILEASQNSLREKGKFVSLKEEKKENYLVHPSSSIDNDVEIEEGTKIWHYSHVLKNSRIGKKCILGQNVMVGPNVVIGNNVKIQNNVSVYDGVTLEDDVFCGPSMVFTNVNTPRSHWPRKNEYQKTRVKKGATLGANSTIVCGIEIGRYAFVGAGALVNKSVPDYALVYGVPAELQGWVCYCGVKLSLTPSPDSKEKARCPNCGREYEKLGKRVKNIG